MQRRKFIAAAGGVGIATVGGAALSGSASATLDGTLEFDSVESVSVDDGSYQHVSAALATVVEWWGFDAPATDVTLTSEIRLPDDDEPADGEWHELFSDTIALEDLGDGRGGSLEYSTGEGTTGVIHSGVGDAEPLTDVTLEREGDHGGIEAGELSAQSADARWPVLASTSTDLSSLYGVPTPLVTDAPEATADGGTNETAVEFRKTVTIENGSESESVELNGSFTVEIENIEAGTATDSEGDATIETDPGKTD